MAGVALELCWILYRSWVAIRSRQQPGEEEPYPGGSSALPTEALASEDVQLRLTILRRIEAESRAPRATFGVLVVGPDPDGYAVVDGKTPSRSSLKAAGSTCRCSTWGKPWPRTGSA